MPAAKSPEESPARRPAVKSFLKEIKAGRGEAPISRAESSRCRRTKAGEAPGGGAPAARSRAVSRRPRSSGRAASTRAAKRLRRRPGRKTEKPEPSFHTSQAAERAVNRMRCSRVTSRRSTAPATDAASHRAAVRQSRRTPADSRQNQAARQADTFFLMIETDMIEEVGSDQWSVGGKKSSFIAVVAHSHIPALNYITIAIRVNPK